MKGNNYLKNVMKSVAYAAADVSGEYMPDIKEFTSSNKEFGINVYRTIKNPSQSLKRAVKSIQESKVYKTLDYGVRNLAEDLRTGNFYNKERKDRDELKFSGLDTNWDDLSEFGIDDNWESNLSSSKNEEISAGDRQIVSSIEGSNAALASATVNAVMSASQNEIMNNRTNTAMVYAQNEKLFGVMHKDITVLGETMQQMYKLQSASLQNIDKNMSEFFTHESKLNTERNAMLKEILEIQRSMYKSSSDKAKSASRKSGRTRWSDISSNGIINISEYFNAVKKNISAELGNFMPAGFGEDSNMLATFMASPLEGLMKYVVNGVIPSTVKAASKEFNDTISGVFGNIIGTLGNARNSSEGGLLGTIAKFLGISTGVNRNIDTSRYEKGPVPFDGITRKAIIDVIPTHLRRIEAALTGRPEEMFDYKSGRWVKVHTLKTEFEKIKKNAIKRATSELRDAMNPGVTAVRKGLTSKSAIQSWDKAVEEFEEYLYDHNGVFNPKVTASKNGIDRASYPNLYNHYNKIRTIYTDFDRIESKDKNGKTIIRNTKISTRMKLANSVMSAREAEDRQYRDIEESVGSALATYFGAPKIDEHGKRSDDGKFKAYNSLRDTTDKLGNTIFDYLQNINKELTWFRMNGLPGGGGRSRRGSNNKGLNMTMEEIHKQLNKATPESNKYNNDNIDYQKSALEAISSGKAVDLTDLDENEREALLRLSAMLSNNAINEYKSEIDGYYNSSAITRFIDDKFVKNNIKTAKDLKAAVKKAEESSKDNDAMNDKEEKFFQKILKKIGAGGGVLGSIVGASGEAFTNLLYSADKAIYDMMFKAEIEDDENRGSKYNGFMEAMVGTMKDKFNKFSEWFKEDIMDPFKERLGWNSESRQRVKDELGRIGSKVWTAFKNSNAEVYGPLIDKVRYANFDYEKYEKEQIEAEKKAKKAARDHRKNIIDGLRSQDLNVHSLSRKDLSTAIKEGTREWGFYESKSTRATEAARIRTLIIREGGDALALWCKENGFTGSLDEKKVRLGAEFGIPSEGLAKIKTHEDANRVFAKQYRHHATGTPSGRPFSGITTLTKGEGFISGSGMGVVPKTGVYNVTSPTHIINRKDMASLKGRSLSNASIQNDLGKEKLAARRSGFNVAHHEKGTNSIKITNDGVDIKSEEVIKEAQKYMPEGIGGGIIGALVGAIVGLPLVGAAVGAGSSIVSHSNSLKDKLFGKEKDGKRDNTGLISKTVVDKFRKYFPDMAKYGMAGILPGFLLPSTIAPFGIIGGLLTGAAFGLLKNNENFTTKYFGEGGALHISSKEKKIIENLLPGAVKGAGAGALVSVLFGGPFGLLGNSALGAGIGMLTTTEEFKDLLLGEKDGSGERVGGILGAFSDSLKPLTDSFRKIGTELGNSIEKRIINPIGNFIKPAIHAIPVALGNIIKRFVGSDNDRAHKNSQTMLGQAINTAGRFIGWGGSKVAKLTTLPFALPGFILNRTGNALKSYDIRNNNSAGMTLREAVDFMDSTNRSGGVSQYFRSASQVGYEGMDLETAKSVRDYLNRMNDTEESARKNFKSKNDALNSFLRNYKLDGGRKLTDNQINEVIRLARNKNYAGISDVLQKRKLKGSKEGMSEIEFNTLMEEGGLKNKILETVEAETRLANIKNIGVNDENTAKIKEYLKGINIDGDAAEELFGDDGKNNRKVFASLLTEQIDHLTAHPENIQDKIRDDNHRNIEDIATTLKDILELKIAENNPDPDKRSEAVKKALENAESNLELGKRRADNNYTAQANRYKELMGSDYDKVNNPANLTPWKSKLHSKTINAIDSEKTQDIKPLQIVFSNKDIIRLEGYFEEAAITAISGLNVAQCEILIKALSNKFIMNAIIHGNYPISIKTIDLLSSSEVAVNTIIEKCKALDIIYNNYKGKDEDKLQIYRRYKSIEDLNEKTNDLNEWQYLKEKYKVDYTKAKSSSKLENIKKKLGFIPKAGGWILRKTAKLGLKLFAGYKALGVAASLLPTTPLPYLVGGGLGIYAGLKGLNNLRKRGGIKSTKWYEKHAAKINAQYDKNHPQEEQQETQTPEEAAQADVDRATNPDAEANAYGTIPMHGIGTALLGAGKALWNGTKAVAKGAGKVIGSLFKKKKESAAVGDEQKAGLMSSLFGGVHNLFSRRSGDSANLDETDKAGDGKDVVHVGDGDMITVERNSDGSVSPDTSDNNTKAVLNKLSLKEKAAQKLHDAQLKASEIIKNTFDTSNVKGSKGGKLGWMSLLLAGGALWKSGVLKTLFDNVIKPVWTDHLKPWIQNSAVPWLQNTAMPALGDVFNKVLDRLPAMLGTAVGTLIKHLPEVIWNGIKGLTKFGAAMLDTLLGNPTNVGAKTTVSGDNLVSKYGEDLVTGLTDANGNAISAVDLAAGKYDGQTVYNADGTPAVVENGQVTFEDPSKPGSGYAKVVGNATVHSFAKAAATGKTSRLVNGAYRVSNFLSRNAKRAPGLLGKIATKGTGVAGKVITKPLQWTGNLGLRYRGWVNNTVESAADRLLNKAIAEGNDEAIEAIVKGDGSKLTKVTQKVFGTDNIIKESAESTATKVAKETSEKAIKEGTEKAAKETAEKVLKEGAEAAVKTAGKNGGFLKSLLSKAASAIEGIFNNATVKKKLAKAAESKGVKNVAEWIAKLKGRFSNVFKEGMEKGVEKVGASTCKQVLSKAFAIAFIIADFLSGADRAESILGVQETSILDEVIVGIINALCNFLIIPAIFPGVNWICRLIYEWLGDDYEKRVKEADAAYKEYIEKTGSTETKEEWLENQNSYIGKAKTAVKNVLKKANKAGGDLYTAIHGDPLEKLEKKRQENRKKGIYTVDNLEPAELLAVRDYRRETGASLEEGIQAVMVDGKRAKTTSTNATGTMTLPSTNNLLPDAISNLNSNIGNIDGRFNFDKLNKTLDRAKAGDIDITNKSYWEESNKSDGTLKGDLGSAYEKISKIMNLPVLMVRNSLAGLSDGVQEISDSITDHSIIYEGTASDKKKKKNLKTFIGGVVNKIKSFFGGEGTGSYKYGTGKYSKQIDPSIANIRFNSSSDKCYQTIGDSGCGPAAAVNAIESMYGRGNTVLSAANYALKNGYKESNGGTMPGFFSDYFNSNGFGSYTSYNRSDIERNIKNGLPTVIMGSNPNGVSSASPFGKNPHYVTVTGLDGKGNAIVQDPESRYDDQLYPLNSLLNNTSLGVSAYGRGTISSKEFGSDTDFIWSYLKQMGMTDAGAAGMMGNLYAESSLKSNNAEWAVNQHTGMDDAQYTAAVDSGAIDKQTFLHPRGGETKNGYGLAQWTSIGRKEGLYDLVKQRRVSIADVKTQMEYLSKELKSSSYKNSVLDVLTSTNDLGVASDAVLTKFERPKNQGSDVKAKRKDYSKQCLDHYKGTAINTTINNTDDTSSYNNTTTENSLGFNSYSSYVNDYVNAYDNYLNNKKYNLSNPLANLTFDSSVLDDEEKYKDLNENSSFKDVLDQGFNKLTELINGSNVGKALGEFKELFNSDTFKWFNNKNRLGNENAVVDDGSDTLYRGNDKAGVNTSRKGKSFEDPYTQPPAELVRIAKQEVGTTESPSGSNNVKYNDWRYGSNNPDRFQEWCANFVSWVAEQAGIPGDIIPTFSYTPYGAKYFEQLQEYEGLENVIIDNPQHAKPGDIFFDYKPKLGRIGHTGIVTEVLADKSRKFNNIYTVEGNAGPNSDQVIASTRRSDDTNLRVYRPPYGWGMKPAGSGTGRGNKPLSRYGQFRDSINSKNVEYKFNTVNSIKRANNSKPEIHDNSRTVNYGMATSVAPDYSKFITAILSILTTIADNTDKLNLIVSILNNKLNLDISAADVSNATTDKQSLKSKLANALNGVNAAGSKFNAYNNNIEDSSMNYIISAMNAIASE